MNRQASIMCLAVVAVALLGGCDSEPRKAAGYYDAHPQEADAKAVECNQQSAAGEALSPNCSAAKHAAVIGRPTRGEELETVQQKRAREQAEKSARECGDTAECRSAVNPSKSL